MKRFIAFALLALVILQLTGCVVVSDRRRPPAPTTVIHEVRYVPVTVSRGYDPHEHEIHTDRRYYYEER